MNEWTVKTHAGGGVVGVARQPGRLAVVWCRPETSDHWTFFNPLRDALKSLVAEAKNVHGSAGATFDDVTRMSPSVHFAAAVLDEDGATVIAAPGVSVAVGSPVASDTRAHFVAGFPEMMTIRVADTPAEPYSFSDLIEGTVVAGGVSVAGRGPKRAPAWEVEMLELPPEPMPAAHRQPPTPEPPLPETPTPAPTPAPSSTPSPEPVPNDSSGSPVATEHGPIADDGGVIVLGHYCQRDHFNDPADIYCAVCGINMVGVTRIKREGIRPSLGVLVLPDGSNHSLDKDVILGRDPSVDPDVASGAATGVIVADEQRLVSRAHARIRLEGWDVVLEDNGSGNGTKWAASGTDQWIPLGPGERHSMNPGDYVLVGHSPVLFETNRRRAR